MEADIYFIKFRPKLPLPSVFKYAGTLFVDCCMIYVTQKEVIFPPHKIVGYKQYYVDNELNNGK